MGLQAVPRNSPPDGRMTDLATAFVEWSRSVPHDEGCATRRCLHCGYRHHGDPDDLLVHIFRAHGPCDCDWLTRVAEGAARMATKMLDELEESGHDRSIQRDAALAALRQEET